LDNPGQVVSADRMRHSRAVLKALRPHQWVKNLLVFVPLLASHQYGSQQSVMHPVLAAIAFGLTASGVYLLNDLLDVDMTGATTESGNVLLRRGISVCCMGGYCFPSR
jgi:hypothetical protein